MVNISNKQIMFEEFASGVSAGTEMFIPSAVSLGSPDLGIGTYESVFAGGALVGTSIDEIQITLPASVTDGGTSWSCLDYVFLDYMQAIPTLSSILLMGTGVLGLIGYRKWSTKTT